MSNLTPCVLLTTFLFFSFLSTTSSSSADVDINWWCKHTPHPPACQHYLAPHYKSHPSKHRIDFYKLSVRVAFDLALRAQSQLNRLSPQCRRRHVHKAVTECRMLYGHTLFQLNRTLHASVDPVDAQTWLSAALTNLHTCSKGFGDLRAPTNIMQSVFQFNVSSLISICLAMNSPNDVKNMSPASRDIQRLRSVANRKLLQLRVNTDIVVAKDGSGHFKSIQAAVDSATTQRLNGKIRRIVIHVKAGVYNEIVQVVSTLTDLTMIGDGKGNTIITGSRSVSAGYTTFSSPTFSVFGDGFVSRGITFRNSFGPGSQAVALLSGSDQSVFYQCSIEGYQDTLCVYTQRQFYRECDIYGTIDFIFGNAAVVIQSCNIFARKPNRGESNVITAQGRTDPNQNTGIVIQNSTIQAAPEFVPVHKTVKSYLGRPWMSYSRTLYLQNHIDGIIDPAGWMSYYGDFALNTLYYVEYKNTGPGSRMQLRVTWPGYHVVERPSFVKAFTVAKFITGEAWIPATTVPFTSGL